MKMTTKGDIYRLAALCEQQELEAPTGIPSPDVYAKLLTIYLLQNDLNNAKYLWKRIPASSKTAHPELGHIWDIGQHLWNRNFVAVYPLLSQDWSDEIKPLMDMLTESIRQRIFRLIGQAYTSIAADQFAAYAGLQVDEAIQAVVAEGWEYDNTNKLILPKRPVAAKASPIPSENHIAQLTDFVTFLES
ncbi:COP9 signalosome complex subunit 8-like [Apostichopus japonicus]|uniref:COP9 signalosome complex subunit 8-like n=1 Tax=Stichopus japonicus TaxID=307972 RepID=UPI003AB34CC1